MLSNMANSLIEHKRINTTLAKAKALRVFVEPLLTKSKEDTVNSRRQVFSYLQNKVTVTELFREIAPKIANRPGGYTRIIKTGFRKGDNAEMCMIELVDFNELMLNDAGAEKKTTRRSRSRRKGDGAAAVVADAGVEATEVVEDVVTTEDVVEDAKATTEDVVEEVTETAGEETQDDAPAADDKENEEEPKA
jgi:large subunit ribosomal protein L17